MMGFPYGSAGKESACNARDLGSIPGLGRSPGEGKGYPLQYPGLENSMGDCIVHGVTQSRTWLRDDWTTFTSLHYHIWHQGRGRHLRNVVTLTFLKFYGFHEVWIVLASLLLLMPQFIYIYIYIHTHTHKNISQQKGYEIISGFNKFVYWELFRTSG